MNARCRPRVVVMVKEPRVGRVKSRLARDAGGIIATQFLRLNLASTVSRLAADPRWQTIIAVSPDSSLLSSLFPSSVRRMPQGGGDLGERMSTVAKIAPAGPMIIIGADIPNISAADIASAFRLLRGRDAVFGASGDGGYWLAGLSARTRLNPPFGNVRWSSQHALGDTIANLGGRRIASVAGKDDVDTGADLKRLGWSAGRRIVPKGN